MDGQCKCGLEGEGTVGGRRSITGLRGGDLSETSTRDRSGKRKDAVADEKQCSTNCYHYSSNVVV